MRMLLPRAAAVVAAVALPLAACGGGSSTSGSGTTGGGNADVTVGAANIAYTGASYTAKAGDFTLALDNKDVVEHNITLTQGNRLLVEAGPKKNVTKTVTLAAGTYEFYCSVPGHNMKATLTVQ